MEYNTIIVRFGEMSTKGKNKKDFINKLAGSILSHLKKFEDSFELVKRHDHIYLNLNEENQEIIDILKEVPGMYSFSLALKTDITDLDELKDLVLNEIKKEEGKTFKMKTRRIDKSFPYNSDEINRILAGNVLKNTPLRVDVHNPDIMFNVEIRDDGIYLFTKTIKGLGGYPKGAIGRSLMMLSGGIDSPVAAYLMMKRGIEISCIHFASPPYTSSAVILKLQDILKELTTFQNKIHLYIVPFTKIQEEIYNHSFQGYEVTIMRRMMYRLAEKLAKKVHIYSICNGESLGQVASQTIESLYTINAVTNYPIIRPLATYDKVDIIKISKQINTYDISIRPYEDCCTIFPIKKPKTAPKIEECLKIEEKFDYETLLNEAIENTEIKIIKAE